MISPELLRRYPFFGHLDEAHLKAFAMLTEEVDYEAGQTICEGGAPADDLYFLIDGCVDLHYVVVDPVNPATRREFYISPVNPGEPFGISALVEPCRYTSTVRTSYPSRVLKLDATGLRALCAFDPKLEATLLRQVARASLARLEDTTLELLAARV